MPDAEGKPTALDAIADRLVLAELRARRLAARSWTANAAWFAFGALMATVVQWI